MKVFCHAILAAAFFVGCASPAQNQVLVRQRAAFDLQCPEDKVAVQTISEDWNRGYTYGAKGCGRQATYLVNSATGGQPELNSPIAQDSSASTPAP